MAHVDISRETVAIFRILVCAFLFYALITLCTVWPFSVVSFLNEIPLPTG